MGGATCKCSDGEREDSPHDETLPGIKTDESDIIPGKGRESSMLTVTGPDAIVQRLLQLADNGDVGSARGLLSAVSQSMPHPRILRKPIQRAFSQGHLQVAELLLDTGYPLNETDEDGDAMLHNVIMQNQLEAASLLLAKSANIEMVNAEGSCPLLVAVDNRHDEMAKLLLRNGASRQVLDARLIEAFQMCDCDQARSLLKCSASIEAKSDDYTPLLYAVDRGQIDLVKLCVEEDAQINVSGADGRSALVIATEKGQVDIVSTLVEHGAEIKAQADNGVNPLLVAARSGHVKLIDLFVSKKASLQAVDKEALAKKLLAAVEKGNADLVKGLLSCGVNAKAKKSDGRSALVLAVELKKVAIAKLLSAKGIEKKDRDILSKKVVEAAQKDDWDLAKTLIACRANPDAKMSDGRTALHIATEKGKMQAVKIMIDSGANKDSKTKDGHTPLLIAAEKANQKIAQLFLDAGVRLTGEKASKLGANLLEAADKGDADLAKFMMQCGVRPDTKDIHGETALHKAAAGGKLDVVEALLEGGASIEIQGGEYGTTPLFYACNNKKLDVAKFLIEKGANKDGRDIEGGEKYEALLETMQAKGDIARSLSTKSSRRGQ